METPKLGMELPGELKDDKTGKVVKAAGRLSVGRAKRYRAVVVSFDDHGALYMMSPLMARKLAQELLDEAKALTQ